MPTTHHTRVLIIGAGPAGYTAAIYAARASLEPMLVAGLQPGGQLMITTDVENYPGFAETIQGPWLMEQMAAQAAHVGTRIVHDIITGVDFSRRPVPLPGRFGRRLPGRLGRSSPPARRPAGSACASEQRLQGAGVSACATCDGFFFRGKRVAVVGGGNTAVEEALYLTHHATDVTLIHRRDTSAGREDPADAGCSRIRRSRWCGTAPSRRSSAPASPPSVDGVRLRNVRTGAGKPICAWTACSSPSAIRPTTDIFSGQVALDAEGYVVTEPGSTRTSVPGVFAAGDVQDKVFRQAVTAAGTGCMAALEAEKWLAEHAADSALAAD